MITNPSSPAKINHIPIVDFIENQPKSKPKYVSPKNCCASKIKLFIINLKELYLMKVY